MVKFAPCAATTTGALPTWVSPHPGLSDREVYLSVNEFEHGFVKGASVVGVFDLLSAC